MALTRCDLALADWLQHCPSELRWNQSQYNFWPAYLNCVYNTASCLLHRAHLPPAPSSPLASTILPRSPAFESAHMITTIVQSLIAHNDLRHAPPFMYALPPNILYSINANTKQYLLSIIGSHGSYLPPAHSNRSNISAAEYCGLYGCIGESLRNLARG